MLKFISILLGGLLNSCIQIPTIAHNSQRIVPTHYDVKLTAYTGNKTALGTRARSGVIATDWSIFPVGTILKINGRNYEVEDYGSALIRPYGSKPLVDVYMTSNVAVRRFGAKYARIEVVKWGSFEKSKKILRSRLKNRHCRLMYGRIN